jgi:hypothetical protein
MPVLIITQLSGLADFKWDQACIIAFFDLQTKRIFDKNAIKQARPRY